MTAVVLPNASRPRARGDRRTSKAPRLTFALAWFELRQLGHAPLFWLGVVSGALLSVAAGSGLWPQLTGSNGLAYHQATAGASFLIGSLLLPSGWVVLAGFAMTAGGWLGRRDRRTGVGEFLAATPTDEARLRAGRLTALAVASFVALALVFGVALAVEAARGATGPVDWLLLVDGGIGTAVASFAGYAVGRSLPAPFALFVPIAYVGTSFYLSVWQSTSALRTSFEWILPTPPAPTWSADVGFAPNIFPTHTVYVLGLLVLVGATSVAIASYRAEKWSARTVAVLALGALGLTGAIVTGSRLQALPDSYAAAGPNPSTWLPEYASSPGSIGLDWRNPSGCPSFGGPPAGTAGKPASAATLRCETSSWPDDHQSMTCSTGPALRACVYPEYQAAARRLVAELEPEARALAPIFGQPFALRMVPVNTSSCYAGAGRVALAESAVAGEDPESLPNGWLISCAFPETASPGAGMPGDEPAVGATTLWLSLEAGVVTKAEAAQALTSDPDGITCYAGLPCTPQAGGVLRGANGLVWSRAEIVSALALERIPPQEVEAGLKRLLPRLIDDDVSVAQLEAAVG